MISFKLKHWRAIGVVLALVCASGCYATGSVGRSSALDGYSASPVSHGQ
jgi:hypothetical protein